MDTIRIVQPNAVQFMVHPLPVQGKKWRGRQVYRSCNHIDNKTGAAHAHPDSFLFVVK